MSEIDILVSKYTDLVQMPWATTLSGAEKVWFVVYTPAQERRLVLRLTEFQVATQNAGHGWQQLDLTNSFAEWMASHEYRDAYFESPEYMESALEEYTDRIKAQIVDRLTGPAVDRNTVVALTGLATLFGLTSVSDLVNAIRSVIRGRLVVFFPGHKDGSNYRFLDAKDGWNYLSIPITAADGT